MTSRSAPFPGSGDSSVLQVPSWYFVVGLAVFVVGSAVALFLYGRDRGGTGRFGQLLVAAALCAFVWPATAVYVVVKGALRLRGRR